MNIAVVNRALLFSRDGSSRGRDDVVEVAGAVHALVFFGLVRPAALPVAI